MAEPRGRPVAEIDLVIPGLFNLPGGEIESDRLAQITPALHQILRFGHWQQTADRHFDELLLRLLKLDLEGLPYAQPYASSPVACEVLCRPVHIKADLNNAFIYPIDLNSDNRLIINELADFFKQDFELKSIGDDLWLMRFHCLQEMPPVPHYLSMLGKSASAVIAQNRAYKDWLLLLNEIQMYLHQHPVNQQRLQSGEATFNSLWCWGGQRYDTRALGQIEWISDHELLDKLGDTLGCQTESSALPATDIEQRIVIDLSLLEALKGQSAQSLTSILVKLEKQVFSSQLSLFKKRLRLFDGQGQCIQVGYFNHLKRWRKKRTLPVL